MEKLPSDIIDITEEIEDSEDSQWRYHWNWN